MATTTENLQAIAAGWDIGVEHAPIIIDLLKQSNFLQTAVVAKASHGIKHEFRTFDDLPSAVFREFGTGIVPQKLGVNTAKIDLKLLEFILWGDEEMILQWNGGKDGWVGDHYQAAYTSLMIALAKAAFYGNDATFGYAGAFKGLHQYAKDLSQVVARKGADTGSRSSIFAVRWEEFDGASLRINNTDLLSVRDMTPTQAVPMITDTTTNEQLDVFKWKFNSYFALTVPSAKSVAAITQVDGTHGVTVADMNDLIEAVEAPTGRVEIYANKVGRASIRALKAAKFSMYNDDMNYNTRLATWDSVPINLEENLSKAETAVLD